MRRDAVDGLLRSRVTGAAGLVQNLSYNWDKVGNLTHRADLNQNLAEDFTMDNLNRLTDSRLTVGSTQTTNLHLVYDASGNISSKSDVGTYLYPDLRGRRRCGRTRCRAPGASHTPTTPTAT